MDCMSPMIDGIASRLWDCAAKRSAYLTDLPETLESLRKAMEELKEVAEDVKTKVDRSEENPEMRRKHEVGGWLQRAETLEKEVMEILQKGDREIQQKCLGTCCPKNCRSGYKIGKMARKKLDAVTELRRKGGFQDVVGNLPRSAADERPIEKTVGLDRMYLKVLRCIQDEQLGIIGLYGMGGAGKTTLMTKVNNEFFKTSKDFEIVIWVVVSRPANLGKIQEVIRNKLKIPNEAWRNRSEDEKAVEIFNVLKRKRFVMLLDDVWERLDLQKVGIPSPNPQNKSKVILTTRSLDVCRHMEAQESIKVECLTQDEAISLFKKKVGETTLNSHPHIPILAEIAAEECKGLPLALVTTGRAMAGKNTPQEWEQAIQMLKTYPSQFSGMGDHVFPILKFSYDNLSNDTIKACFLYLAMFPEDYKFKRLNLIILWLGEGFLDEFACIDEAFNQGHHIISHLKAASLFEGDEYDQIKMHDVIRDMALWLGSEHRGNKNRVLVEEEVDYVEPHQILKWKEAQQMFLSSTGSLKELPSPPSFPNLSTLIFRNQVLGTLPSGLFHFMPVIRVLDLSRSKITELPVGIGGLVTLQYLDLSGTKLRELPVELKTLKTIKYLVLAEMPWLRRICKEVISNLPMMRYFTIRPNYLLDEKAYCLHKEDDNRMIYLWEDSEALLEELEGLKHIEWICAPISGVLSLKKLLSSQKLQNALRYTGFRYLEGMTLLRLPRMKHLQFLRISKCWELQDVKVDDKHGFAADYIPNSSFYSLRSVRVHQLPKLLNLTWLIYIPSLEDLEAMDCESLKEVIGETGNLVSDNFGIFSRLKILSLSNLPNLKSISGRALMFPSLTNLWVKKCPNLRKLPFDSNTARISNLKTIRGETEWWEGLEWDDETTKHIFSPYLEETIM